MSLNSRRISFNRIAESFVGILLSDFISVFIYFFESVGRPGTHSNLLFQYIYAIDVLRLLVWIWAEECGSIHVLHIVAHVIWTQQFSENMKCTRECVGKNGICRLYTRNTLWDELEHWTSVRRETVVMVFVSFVFHRFAKWIKKFIIFAISAPTIATVSEWVMLNCRWCGCKNCHHVYAPHCFHTNGLCTKENGNFLNIIFHKCPRIFLFSPVSFLTLFSFLFYVRCFWAQNNGKVFASSPVSFVHQSSAVNGTFSMHKTYLLKLCTSIVVNKCAKRANTYVYFYHSKVASGLLWLTERCTSLWFVFE